jgi:SAM-dependent MidA family methyltransferase
LQLPPHLPAPSAGELELSAALTRAIRAEIDAHGGAIPFRRFMELALYAPGLGYYMSGVRKFGADGDFVTAPEISPLFGRCVARQCAEILALCTDPVILEAGAGTGALAADVLLELEKLGRLPGRYLILELSATLRARQRETLATRAPRWLDRVEWLDRLPDQPFSGAILANELLDAMPVHAVRIEPDRIVERRVTWHDDRFAWCDGAPESARLRERAAALRAQVPAGYETEINLSAEAWIETLAPTLRQGALLLIDYGFPAREFYHSDRATGTLMCHYRHHTHPDPLVRVGLQDITAHVDFSAIAQSAHDAGLHVAGFTTQAYFLLALGLAQMADEAGDDHARWRIAQHIQKLTSPAEMGELFKVIALTKNLDVPLSGFALIDHRRRL